MNFGHWHLFEPALARLDWCKPSSIANFQFELINAIGVNPVWARDLYFGAWNFHDIRKRWTLFSLSIACLNDAASLCSRKDFTGAATPVWGTGSVP